MHCGKNHTHRLNVVGGAALGFAIFCQRADELAQYRILFALAGVVESDLAPDLGVCLMLVAVEEVVAFLGQGAVRSLVAPLAVVPSEYVADIATDAAVRSHDTVLEAKEN